MSSADAGHLARYIEAKIHPRVRRVVPADLPRLWPVYEETGVFARHRAGPVLARIERERRGLFQRGSAVLVELVGQTGDQPQGTVSVLQAYPGTWSIQHLRIVEGSRLSADQLLVPAIEMVVRRADFRYLHALLRVGDADVAARLREIPTDGRGLSWREWLACTPAPDYVRPATGDAAIHEAKGEDLDWIAAKIDGYFNTTERDALALGRAEINLVAIDAIYRPAGVERHRQVRVAMSIAEPLGFALVEESSPGVTLTGIADATRIVPSLRREQARVTASLALMHDVAAERAGAGPTPLLLVDVAMQASLAGAGFISLGKRIEVIASAENAAQVINFVNLLG